MRLKWSVKVAQSCPTLCNIMDYTVHGILQARILVFLQKTQRLRKTLATISKVITPKYDRSLRFSQVYDMKEISYGFLKLYTELEHFYILSPFYLSITHTSMYYVSISTFINLSNNFYKWFLFNWLLGIFLAIIF